jgi:SAM-dependent methyltransferase
MSALMTVALLSGIIAVGVRRLENNQMKTSTTFDELLNVFWLRPETAMWRELDIKAMESFEFRSPSLDLGCGDGNFSFIRAGGGFDLDFDAFRAMRNLDGYFESVDVFDAYDENECPHLTRPSRYQIDYGYDHKENLLKKAALLRLYKNMQTGDANQSLPFPNESFNSLFSNIVYWLNDPQAVISEISRILRPGGQACLMLPNRTMPEFSFYNQLYVKTGNPDWAFLEKLDRGRFKDNIRQARSAETWDAMFASAGLRVNLHKRHLSKTVVQAWDIGLRPLFPALLKMADALPVQKLPEIKQEWITILKQFLLPLVQMDDRLGQSEELGFHCYILEK